MLSETSDRNDDDDDDGDNEEEDRTFSLCICIFLFWLLRFIVKRSSILFIFREIDYRR